MRRFLVLVIIALVILLPVASADDSGAQAHNQENDLRFTQFPQVYVNVSNNASFNVSYVGMLLFTSTGGMYYSYFPYEHWLVKRVSNDSVSYLAKVTFKPMDVGRLGLFKNEFNLTNIPARSSQSEDSGDGGGNLTAIVKVTMVKAYLPNPLNNISTSSNLTGFRMTFELYSTSITGSGDLLLIQQLGAKIHNEFEQYHILAKFASAIRNGTNTTIGVTSSSYDAYYWWNDSYSLNGHVANFTSITTSDGNIDTVVFKYEYNNGLKSIVQDPYFSVPQINLFNNPIIQKDIQNATTFIVVHAELFGAGLATGIALIGITYGSYRRKRF